MKKVATKVIHEGYAPEPLASCVAPPIYMSTTYAQEGVGGHKGYEYARSNNPTREMLEKNLSALENAVGSCGFATGMAAISTLILSFKSQDHILVSSNVYGGTYRAFVQVFANFGLEFEFIDTTNPELVKKSIKSNTRLLFIETPTNPLMEISDIQLLCDIAHEKGVQVCVDNTFCTPILQRPIDLGADYVIHSATKYLGGHSDVLGGLLCMKNKEDHDRIKFVQKSTGGVLAPFDSWLILRGIKTLAARMRMHEENAREVAKFLSEHPKVKRVYYPGLEDHPGFEIAKRQADGFGAMLSFEIKSDQVNELLSHMELFTLAESLGAVESLVCIPALMTHASVPKVEREKIGISDSLIRLSIGIEDCQDILQDLEQSLAKL